MYMLVLSLFSLGICTAQGVVAPIPILEEDPGIRFDESSVGAQLRLEAFIELNCPDSIYSWPILKDLQEFYGADNLEVVIHHVPLPYHRQAFLLTQGFNVIKTYDRENAIAYIDQIFENNGRFGNLLTRNMNELEVIRMIADLQEEVTNFSSDEFYANMTGGEGYADTIFAWKYGTRRNVAGTPWFWINNIDLAVNPSIRLSYNDWRELLDPIIGNEDDLNKSIEENDKSVEDNTIPEIDEDAVKTQVSNENKIRPVHHHIRRVDSNIKIPKRH